MAKSVNNIYRLSSPDFVWKKVGEFNFARYGHNVVMIDDIFFVVGGTGYYETEGCRYSRDEIKCVKQEPKLNQWQYFPVLMPVSKNYCQ